jgi:exopolyphosphatase/guanosine-5'-triphosphate,3'-diphosphate pyrophosphatase
VKIAIVDLGTNTCRLLLAEVEDGAVWPAARETRVVRLGQGVDRRGRLAPAAVDRTVACLSRYAGRIQTFGPERALLVATSALRDAADGAAFLDDASARFALPHRVIDGSLEGRLSYRGARAGLAEIARTEPARPASPATVGSLLVVDIGGGSTELAIGGGADVEPHFVRSLDVGAVRLTERLLSDDPPTAEQVDAAVALLREHLGASVPVRLRRAVARGVGVAGTFTTLVAHTLGLTAYRRERVHGYELGLPQIEEAIARFRVLSSCERAGLVGIQSGREDVILAGALIGREVCLAFGLPAIVVSESDIIEGAALWLAEQPA